MQEEEPYIPPFIRRLMPDATEQEIVQAAENLRAYLKVLYGIFLEREAKAQASDSPHGARHDRFQDGAKPPNI